MSANKAKGTAMETAVVNYLREHGFPYAERRACRGAKDAGDISGVVSWAVEVKSCARTQLAEWCKEAAAEAKNASARYWCVVFKRRGKGVADAFVLMPLSTWAELVGDEPAGAA